MLIVQLKSILNTAATRQILTISPFQHLITISSSYPARYDTSNISKTGITKGFSFSFFLFFMFPRVFMVKASVVHELLYFSWWRIYMDGHQKLQLKFLFPNLSRYNHQHASFCMKLLCNILLIRGQKFQTHIQNTAQKIQFSIRDDTHMKSMKIFQFSRSPTPLDHLRPKLFHPFDLGRPISDEPLFLSK